MILRREVALAFLTSVAVLLLNVVYVSSHLGFVHKPRRVLETDHFRYIEMAKGARGDAALAHEPPFCWRVLVPEAAGLLARTGMSLNAAFYTLTNLTLLGFLLALYGHLRTIGLRARAAHLGILLAGLVQGAVRWYEYQYWMTDPACLLLLTLAVWAASTGRWRSAAAATGLGALARESILVVLPFAFVRGWRRESLAAAFRKTLLLAAPPLLVLGVLHAVVRPASANPLGAVLVDALSFRWRHLSDNQPYVLTVGTWGVLLSLLLLFPERLRQQLRSRPELVALTAAAYATLVVANNTERLLVYALPAALPAALRNLDRFAAETRIPWSVAALAAVGVQAYVWRETRLFDMGVSLYQPSNARVVAATIAIWLAALLLRGTRRRSAPVLEANVEA